MFRVEDSMESKIREYWLTHLPSRHIFRFAANYRAGYPKSTPTDESIINNLEIKHQQYQVNQVRFYVEGLDYYWKQISSFYDSDYYWQDTIVSKFVVTDQIRNMWSAECLFLRDFDTNDLVYEAEYRRRQWATTIQQHPDFFNIMMLTDFSFRKRIQLVNNLLKEDGSQVVWN